MSAPPSLLGMTHGEFAAAAGVSLVIAFRGLERAVREGHVVRIETNRTTLYARPAGGNILQVALTDKPKATAPTAPPRAPRDRQPKRTTKRQRGKR